MSTPSPDATNRPEGGAAAEGRSSRFPPNLPSFYADQIVDVVYGVHTTRLVFGIEDGATRPRPIATVVIPTATLIGASVDILKDLSRTGLIEETERRFGAVLNVMRSLNANLGKAIPDDPASLEAGERTPTPPDQP